VGGEKGVIQKITRIGRGEEKEEGKMLSPLVMSGEGGAVRKHKHYQIVQKKRKMKNTRHRREEGTEDKNGTTGDKDDHTNNVGITSHKLNDQKEGEIKTNQPSSH